MQDLDVLKISCGQNTDTLIYFSYPWAGNAGNTQYRLQRIANELGCDIIAAHAPGTGALRTPREIRSALHSNSYELLRKLSIIHVNELSHVLSKENKVYVRRIGWGDSGRSWLIATMALNSDLFTHVLTRDGAILNRVSIARGALTLLRNGGKRFDSPSDMPSENIRKQQGIGRRAYEVAAAVAEMGTYRDIMCTTDVTAQSLRDLAAKSSIPFCNVMFGHGISGSAREVQAFNAEILALRGNGDSFHGLYEPQLGHGNLQDWRIAMRHLQAVLVIK